MKSAKVIDTNDEMFGFEGDVLSNLARNKMTIYFDDLDVVLTYRKDQVEILEG
jgi:hypothetical protein